MNKYPVFLASCENYNVEAIFTALKAALPHLSLKKTISGQVVIKPNLVMAHPRIATEGFTRKEVIEAILKLVREEGKGVEKISVVEKSGLGVTTAAMFRWAGYKTLKKKYGVKLCAMEQRRRSRVGLQKGRIHKHVSIAREMAEQDFLIFAPKLKTNVLSHAYSGALKLNIGIIDSKERLFHHHYNLPVKIVDLLEVANPDLIVSDGIRFAFGGNQMTQPGIHMGVVAISTNAVAHDMVCARLLGLDPGKIDHIQEAVQRDYGPSSFEDIEIMGDFPMQRGQEICQNLDFGFYPVEKFPSHMNIIAGKPYCHGGCQGIFLDWLHMVKDRKPHLLRRFPKIPVLIGKVDNPPPAQRYLLVGDCAILSGVKNKRKVRIKGCPPTHKRIVLDMMMHFRLLAPLVRPSLIIDGFVLYPIKKCLGRLRNMGKWRQK